MSQLQVKELKILLEELMESEPEFFYDMIAGVVKNSLSISRGYFSSEEKSTILEWNGREF